MAVASWEKTRKTLLLGHFFFFFCASFSLTFHNHINPERAKLQQSCQTVAVVVAFVALRLQSFTAFFVFFVRPFRVFCFPTPGHTRLMAEVCVSM